MPATVVFLDDEHEDRQTLRLGRVGSSYYYDRVAVLSGRDDGSLYLDRALYVAPSQFGYVSSLTYVGMSLCREVMHHGFYYCSALGYAYLPSCVTIGASAFCGCSALTSVSAPTCETVGRYAFSYCTSLASVSMPACESVGHAAFSYCTSLSHAYLPRCSDVGGWAFAYCLSLMALDLTGVRSVPALGPNAFYTTPIGGYSASTGGYGSVYVPASLYDAFVSARGWMSVASRIASA